MLALSNRSAPSAACQFHTLAQWATACSASNCLAIQIPILPRSLSRLTEPVPAITRFSFNSSAGSPAVCNHTSPTPGRTRLTMHPMILLPIRRQQSSTRVSIELHPTSTCATRLLELSLTTFLPRLSAHSEAGCCAAGPLTAYSRHGRRRL